IGHGVSLVARSRRRIADGSPAVQVNHLRACVKGLIGIACLEDPWNRDAIFSAGDHFLTGTEIARALVAYAAALARQGSAGAIEIPVRHEEDGRPGGGNFLGGPASQLVTESVAPGGAQ